MSAHLPAVFWIGFESEWPTTLTRASGWRRIAAADDRSAALTSGLGFSRSDPDSKQSVTITRTQQPSRMTRAPCMPFSSSSSLSAESSPVGAVFAFSSAICIARACSARRSRSAWFSEMSACWRAIVSSWIRSRSAVSALCCGAGAGAGASAIGARMGSGAHGGGAQGEVAALRQPARERRAAGTTAARTFRALRFMVVAPRCASR